MEIHGETLPIEVASRAVNLMGNLLRISNEVKYILYTNATTIPVARSILFYSDYKNFTVLLQIKNSHCCAVQANNK